MQPGDLPSLAMLRAFEAAARTLSFTEAGREMNVSHAAISQHVRRLEAHLDRSLIVRSGRGLALTADGAALGQRLTEGFGTIREALEAFSQDDASRPLSVTMTPMFAMNWLLPRLPRFHDAHPGVELMLNPTAQLVDMSGRDYDLAIRYGEGSWPGFDVQPLVVSRFIVVGAPELVAKLPDTRPETLMRATWLQEFGTDEITRWLALQGISAPRPGRITNLPGFMIPDAVRQGQGLACLTRAFIEEDLRSGAMAAVHESSDDRQGYYIVTRPGPMRPPLRAFAAWLRREARDQPQPSAPPPGASQPRRGRPGAP